MLRIDKDEGASPVASPAGFDSTTFRTVSARNSTYWFEIAAQQRSIQHSILIDQTRVEEIYENQRYQPVIGWGSKGRLLPTDPSKYTDKIGKERHHSFPNITLPETDHVGCWEWTSPWYTSSETDGCDKNGWTYGTSFASIRAGYGSAMWKSTTFVRQRKWRRTQKFIPYGAKQTITAFDDSHLDTVAGWLYKLGHRRKNWKKRFFVLDRSILRYFKDDSKSRVRGEILLFHHFARVHAVDIRISQKENTFAIEAGDYRLLLEADCPESREHWICAIEDAILCRDSYMSDAETDFRRDFVAKRRSISSDVLNISPYVDFTRKRSLSAQEFKDINSLLDHDENAAFVESFLEKYANRSVFRSDVTVIEASTALKEYRQYMDSRLQSVMDSVILGDTSSDEYDNRLSKFNEDVLRELEQAIFIPLQTTIYQLTEATLDESKAKLFEMKKKWLSQQTQNFFEISEAQSSSCDWSASITLLNALDDYSLPYEKSSLLVRVARSIYATCEKRHEIATVKLGADDFLPIFIYVLCQSNLMNIMLSRKLISLTLPHSVAVSEIGYYVTMLEAASEYVSFFKHPLIPQDIITIEEFEKKEERRMHA